MSASRDSLEAALSGGTRRRIVDEVCKAKTFDRSVRHLRDGMRAHAFESAGSPLFSGRWVKAFDLATRKEGFHALNDWDGKADRFNDDIIPVEVASFAERMIRHEDHAKGRVAIAILLDYYFVHLLGLLALRAWDEGDPNRNLDEVTRLLGGLQGPEGSGQVFARDAEALERHDLAVARNRVIEVLDRIHPRYREAIRLRILEEKSREEAAQTLGVSIGTFDVVLHRAMAAVRKALARASDS